MQIPKIYFERADLFDDFVGQIFSPKISKDLSDKADDAIIRIENIWEEIGERILTTLIGQTDRSFDRSELSAFVTLSKISSLSHPLFISLYKYCDFENETLDFRIEAVVDTIFHELLHIFLGGSNLVEWPTPLVKKSGDIPFQTKVHLHLLSLQKLVYSKIGTDYLLEHWNNYYEINRSGDDYHLAWKIISENDNYLNFVGELKKLWIQKDN